MKIALRSGQSTSKKSNPLTWCKEHKKILVPFTLKKNKITAITIYRQQDGGYTNFVFISLCRQPILSIYHHQLWSFHLTWLARQRTTGFLPLCYTFLHVMDWVRRHTSAGPLTANIEGLLDNWLSFASNANGLDLSIWWVKLDIVDRGPKPTDRRGSLRIAGQALKPHSHRRSLRVEREREREREERERERGRVTDNNLD